MHRTLLVILSLICVACGAATAKVDPLAETKQNQNAYAGCPLGFNPIPEDRGGAVRLPDLAAIPKGNYAIVSTKFLISVRDRRRTALTYITQAGATDPKLQCTNFTNSDSYGLVLPGFGRWTNQVREAVLGRSFTFLWEDGAMNLSYREDWSPEDPNLAGVLRFFHAYAIYDLGGGSYDIRGNRLETVGALRVNISFSYEFKKY